MVLGWSGVAHGVAAAGKLELDDFHAQFTQHGALEGAQDHGGEVNKAHAVQHLGFLADGLLVVDVAAEIIVRKGILFGLGQFLAVSGPGHQGLVRTDVVTVARHRGSLQCDQVRRTTLMADDAVLFQPRQVVPR